MSRSAKNQKDFKVTALDDWRKENMYACLIAPLYQFPNAKSQIYAQAITKNVVLLSYTHLRFLLNHRLGKSLSQLWGLPKQLKVSREAHTYWENIDRMVVEITSTSLKDLHNYKKSEATAVQQIGQEGIEYWQKIVESYQRLSQAEAVQRLIRAEKIEQKTEAIEGMIQRVRQIYG